MRFKRNPKLKFFKGKYYRDEGKVWLVSSDLHRHDGHFLFLRRDDDRRIIMKEVRADESCLVEGDDAS